MRRSQLAAATGGLLATVALVVVGAVAYPSGAARGPTRPAPVSTVVPPPRSPSPSSPSPATLTAAATTRPTRTPSRSAPVSTVAAPPLRPVRFWVDKFLESWDYDRKNGLASSHDPDSWQHYEVAYDVDASTAMFRATGATRYLDRALEYVTNVMDSARVSSSLPTSQFHDDYLGWVSQRPDLTPTGVEVPLYESYFWRYASTLLRVLRQTPAVYANAGYRDRYRRMLDFAEVQVFEKWDRRGGIFRERTHMSAHWAAVALNLASITEDPARRARYREVVGRFDRGLRGQLRRNPAHPSAYFWNDAWGSHERPGQDVSHANGVMAYVVESRDLGTYWTEADMAGFSALLTEVVWPDGTKYAAYLDGSGSDNGWFSDGFVKLGRYDPAVQYRLERHRVVNAQFAANMALNAKVLG